MAQSGYTTIQLYNSTTAGHVPIAANLVAGELAINNVDGKLYYKNSSGVVTLLASAGGAAGVFTSVTTPIVNGITTLTLETNGVAALTFDANQNGTFNSTGAVQVPAGTTAQRPTPTAGDIRFNTDINEFEGYASGVWSQIGGGATGGGSDKVFVQNQAIVTTNYTLTTGFNAESVGPITINGGVTVTVPSGQRWVVL